MTQNKLNYNVTEFCHATGISRGLFYKLLKEGAGPRICRIGRRVLITHQAAEEWLTSLEQGGGDAF